MLFFLAATATWPLYGSSNFVVLFCFLFVCLFFLLRFFRFISFGLGSVDDRWTSFPCFVFRLLRRRSSIFLGSADSPFGVFVCLLVCLFVFLSTLALLWSPLRLESKGREIERETNLLNSVKPSKTS